MAYEWQDNLRVGDDRLDSQHQELFATLNRLLAACSTGTSQVEIKDTLAFLEEYICFHFQEEESLMRQVAYPDLDSHRHKHDVFRRQVENIIDGYHQDGTSILLVAKVNSLLSSWLITHIKQEDFKLVLYLRSISQSASVEEKGDL